MSLAGESYMTLDGDSYTVVCSSLIIELLRGEDVVTVVLIIFVRFFFVGILMLNLPF